MGGCVCVGYKSFFWASRAGWEGGKTIRCTVEVLLWLSLLNSFPGCRWGALGNGFGLIKTNWGGEASLGSCERMYNYLTSIPSLWRTVPAK